jgi:hypothetical protein
LPRLPVVGQITDAYRVGKVFQNDTGIAGSGIRLGTKTSGPEIRQVPQQALIDLGLVGNVAAMAERGMALAAGILDE